MHSNSRSFLSAVFIGTVLAIAAPVSVGFAREFTVQVLSSSDTAAAEKTKEALRKDGLDAYVDRAEGANAAYRVRIGRFASRKDAEQLQEQLRSKGIASWIAFAEAESPAQQKKPLSENDEPEKNAPPPAGAAEPAAAPALPAPEPSTAKPAETAAQPAADSGRLEAAPPSASQDTKPSASVPTAPEPPTAKPAEAAAQPAADSGRLEAAPPGAAQETKPSASAPTAPDPSTAKPAEAAAQPVADSGRLEAAPPGAAQETKIFELVINPEPTFADEPAQAAATAATTTTTALSPCRPDKHYAYYDPRDATLHITAEANKIPGLSQKQLRRIIIFPAGFKQMNLHDMSMQVEIEEKPVVIALDGITRPQLTPARQAVLDFESMLRENPLRILYYPPRTDPDGTLHGALFFKNGASVEQEMVRRGLAACEGAQPDP